MCSVFAEHGINSIEDLAGCATDGSTVMGYFDGNTVTAMWQWAQRFAMSDNSWGTTYGPSTPGALNLISGQTAGAVVHQFSGTKGKTGQLTDKILSSTVADEVFIGSTNPMVPANMLGADGAQQKVQAQTGTLVNDLDLVIPDTRKSIGDGAVQFSHIH